MTLVFVHAEELFSLGQEELGLLGDKDKPEAKVSAHHGHFKTYRLQLGTHIVHVQTS